MKTYTIEFWRFGVRHEITHIDPTKLFEIMQEKLEGVGSDRVDLKVVGMSTGDVDVT